MKKLLIVTVCIMLVLLFTGCGNDQGTDQNDTPEEATPTNNEETEELPEGEEALQQALEAKGIEEIDRELTDLIMAEEDVRYAYVYEEEDVIKVHITFYAGTDSQTLSEVSKMAKEISEEKYPGQRVTVDGSIDT